MPRPNNEILFHSPAIFEGQTGQVDTDKYVIKGVSLITGNCVAEGHDLQVDDKTVTQLHELAKERGKVPVNLDHGSGIKDMNGFVDNFRLDGGKLRGDWHLLRSHAESPLMLERATMMPECFGLSVAFKGKGVAVGAGKKAARAEKLLSVDCVTRPAANIGLFSAKDGDPVDMAKNIMDGNQGTQGAANAGTPTLQDVMGVLSQLSDRLGNFESVQQQLVDAHNSSVEGAADEGMDREQLRATLERLNTLSDAELQQHQLTRQDLDAAIDEFNATMVDGEGDPNADPAATGDPAATAGAGDPAAAGAGVAAGAATGGTAELKALQREVINLRSGIEADKRKAFEMQETMEFSAIEGKMITLATQRDRAIELAENLVVENEALRLHIRTGTRPVRPGVDNNVRLFSANANGDLHEFQLLVKTIQGKKDGRSEGEAIKLAMKEPNGPALHADYLQSLQGSKVMHG